MRSKKHTKLNQSQLDEIAMLAKTKTLTEVAAHFNMSKTTFKLIRKEQPEIDQIYYHHYEQRHSRVYTKEDVLEIEKLATTLNIEAIAQHFGTSYYYFQQARMSQPELNDALLRGIANRGDDFSYKQKQKRKVEAPQNPIKEKSISDSLANRAPQDISTEDALKRFYYLRQLNKEKEYRKELKELDL